MYNPTTHIVTRCEWNTAFDSKSLATEMQMYISKWSRYKMQRIMNTVFDSICPEGQTLKIKKLAIDLGAITYENMERELPNRLKDALYKALHSLIMYPKSGDQTLEIINANVAQIHVLRAFLLQGMVPWNYNETYGSINHIIATQLSQNRLDVIQMIQEIGVSKNVRKRIVWQFNDRTIKKIIIELEPSNHRQIISFSDELIKVQEKENVLKTSINDFKKNLWLWILNYLFVDRGTIFNKTAFVRSTITQIANHFNISYDILIELIEAAINRKREYSHIDKDFIAILRLLSEELHHKAYTAVKTEKQQENFWHKVVTYFSSTSARSTTSEKNEFNELVINLSKLDATRFQKIVLNVEQKPKIWETILTDLIPAAIENLFVSLAPLKSKNVLTQIEFISKLRSNVPTKISKTKLYALGIEFCIQHKNASISKHAFLEFTIEKLAKNQQQTKLAILDRFLTSPTSNVSKEAAFVSLYKTLNTLYHHEITTTKTVSSIKTTTIVNTYVEAITTQKAASNEVNTLESQMLQWIAISPKEFWKTISEIRKTNIVTVHITALISTYGKQRFLKEVQPEIAAFLKKIQGVLDRVITENSKHAHSLRTIKRELIEASFTIIWKGKNQTKALLFLNILKLLQQEKSVGHFSNFEEAIQLVLKHPTMKTIGWSSQQFASIQQQYKVHATQTPLACVLETIHQSNQEEIVAQLLTEVVRAKKIQTALYKAHEKTLISYLLSNGIQLRKQLIAKFLHRILKTKPSKTEIQIQTVLHDCFWQTMILYNSYRGNEQKFILLFEETVLQTFPSIETKEIAVKKQLKTIALQTPIKITTVALFEALQQHLETGNERFQIAKKIYSFSEVFSIGLETSSKEVRMLIKQTVISKKQVSQLQTSISFEKFITLIAHDLSNSNQEIYKAIQVLFVLAKQLGNVKILEVLASLFWKETIDLIQSKSSNQKRLETLVTATFDQLATIPSLDATTIAKHIQHHRLQVPAILKNVLVSHHTVFEIIVNSTKTITLSKAMKTCIEKDQIEALSSYLITQFTIPAWFQHTSAYTYKTVLHELFSQQPYIVLKTIRSNQVTEVQLTKLSQTIRFSTLIQTLEKSYPLQQKHLSDIQKLYDSIALISSNRISTKSLQDVLSKKVWTAWQTSNWSLITSSTIWNELLWETCGKKSMKKHDFIQAIQTIKTSLPAALQVTFKSILPVEKKAIEVSNLIQHKTLKQSSMKDASSKLLRQGVSVPNAGLVLLNNYFLMLLERLGTVSEKAFVSTDAQLNAVHYFQYVVTGLTETEESLLTLNKILSGLSPDAPIRNSIEMTNDEKQLINGLIQAVIGYWSAIGDTSVNGFRGNWLVRDGILREAEDRWELTVEKRAYDILLMKSPFSFSIIKLPWMQKPLHVTWPY